MVRDLEGEVVGAQDWNKITGVAVFVMATDLAEVVGTAIASELLFDLPSCGGAAHCRDWPYITGFLCIPGSEQHRARAMKAGHHRPDRHARYLGDILVTEFMQLAQYDHLA